MSDFGIKISAKGKDVKTATGVDVFMNMRYPFAKLDIANANSFRNIILTFVNDTPEPAPDSNLDVLVYSFAHGYTYTPSSWALIQVASPPAAWPTVRFKYFQDRGLCVDNGTFVSQPYFFTTMDSSRIYFYINKTRSTFDGGNVTTNLVGLQLKIRVYVFAEDITSTSI